MKKFLLCLMAICFVILGGSCLSACSLNNNEEAAKEIDGYSVYLQTYYEYVEKLFDVDSYIKTTTQAFYDGYGFYMTAPSVETCQFYNDGAKMKFYTNDRNQGSGESFAEYVEVVVDHDHCSNYKITRYNMQDKTYTISYSYKDDEYLAYMLVNELQYGYLYSKERFLKMEKMADGKVNFYFVIFDEDDDSREFTTLTFENSMLVKAEEIIFCYDDDPSSGYTAVLKNNVTFEFDTNDFEVDVSECQPA